jgi:ApeA N-terminal domain 1/Apea-like HEPN
LEKDKKHYGDIWFVGKEDQKQFCVLFFKDDDIFLETNLCSEKTVYKELQIVGVFTGLGYVTFIDCKIQSSTSGISELRVYKPKYTFISPNHFINAIDLQIKEFFIVNDAIVKWVNFSSWYDTQKNHLTKKEFKDEFKIEKENISIEIQHYINYHSKKRSELHIINKGAIKFKLVEPVNILNAIEIYDQFQKVLQLLRGGSEKFDEFSFRCLSCNEWQELYYNDKKVSKKTTTFVHTNYDEVTADLTKVLNVAYVDNDFKFCLDRLMENFINNHSSHSKRFTNSISAFEAYSKIYSGIKPSNLKKYLKHYESVFKLIGKLNEEDWESFPGKLIRSRNYHIHSDLNNKHIFTDFELLYISFLIDYVIGYLLLKNIGASQLLLDKFIMHGSSVYVDMKRTNEILGANPLNC